MKRILEKVFLAEVVRQHPEIRPGTAFVDAVLIATDEICIFFDLETELPEKTSRRGFV
jgi:hypothetical protein